MIIQSLCEYSDCLRLSLLKWYSEKFYIVR